MNARVGFSIAALCIAGALAGCGSVTSGLAFQAPAGWTGTPAMFGHLQMWMKSTGGKGSEPELVMLVKGNANSTAITTGDIPSQYVKDAKIVSRGSVKLCGTQPAEQMIAEGTDRNGKRSRIEMVSTAIKNDRYVAMYVRPVTVSADPAAESSIHSLCPAP